MESCSLYKSLQKLVHLEGRVDCSKVIMKKPTLGICSSLCTMARLPSRRSTFTKQKLKDILLSRKKNKV